MFVKQIHTQNCGIGRRHFIILTSTVFRVLHWTKSLTNTAVFLFHSFMGLSVILMMNAGLPTKVKTLDNIGLKLIGLVSYLVHCTKSYTDCTEYTNTNKKRLYFINL